MTQVLAFGPNGPVSVGQTSTAQRNILGLLLNEVGGVVPYDEAVTESASAVDGVSALGVFADAVSESGSAADTAGAGALFAEEVDESASAADSTTWGSSHLHAFIAETASAQDTPSATGAFNTTIAESTDAKDTQSMTRLTLTWYLDFEDVTPPPELEGPGNPGVLKAGYRLLPTNK